MSDWKVWKHDCIKDGMGTRDDGSSEPCYPLCDFPWQVDGPVGRSGAVFRSWAEALEWATFMSDGEPN